MAHGDYHCCALCDRKMEYADDARTKEDICIDCLRKLHGAEIMVYDGAELVAWIKANPQKAVAELPGLGLSKCFYGNAVDQAFAEAAATVEAAATAVAAGPMISDQDAQIEVLRRAVEVLIFVIETSCKPAGNPDVNDQGEIDAAIADARTALGQ